MKKQIVFFCFMLLSIAGFSQISKADATGFLTRNPIGNCDKFVLYNSAGIESDRAYNTKVEYNKADIGSLVAADTGFLLVVNQNGVKREKFYPYASIKYIQMTSDNSFVIVLLN